MMKYRTTFIQCLFLIGLAFCFLNSSSGRVSVDGRGNTGAPGESGGQCNGCHGGTAFGVTTTDISLTPIGGGSPITSYNGGETYDMVVTVNHTMGTPAGFGFQMTALSSGDTDVANFSNFSSNTKLSLAFNVGNRRYAEHSMRSATNTFTMQWTAPSTGTGDVTFYHIGNSVNGGGTNGDSGGAGMMTVLSEAALSVALTSFEVRRKNKTALLSWQTTSETNNAYFNIEHSLDGRTFESLAKVEGAGTSANTEYYSYQHKEIVEGTNYYRLKQTDIDGTYQYSNIITLEQKDTEVTIYPNPVQDILNIDSTEELLVKEIQIFNSQGQLISTVRGSLSNLRVGDLQSGLYLLSIELQDGTQSTHRFLKS